MKRIIDLIKGLDINSFRIIKLCLVIIILVCIIVLRVSQMDIEAARKMPLIIIPDFSLSLN